MTGSRTLARGRPASSIRSSSASPGASPWRPPPRRIRVGCLSVVLPDGSRRVFGDVASEPARRDPLHEPRPLRVLIGGETGGGEAYMDGLWSSPDLAALLSAGRPEP